MKVLVTGAAGFIGFYTALRLAQRGDEVVGLDSLNDYYEPELKYARLTEAGIGAEAQAPGKITASAKFPNYRFTRMELEEREALEKLFEAERFDAVCHLAAQAGVRYSLANPHAYAQSNLCGFLNVLEAVRKSGTTNLCYASSSSVYGLNTHQPFSTEDAVNHPVSLYAATKKANELMAHAYSHLYAIRATGLRFFTVYGPWGRPDMAYFLFTKAVFEGKPITINNFGDMKRDFTYIDDIVEGVVRVIDAPAEPDAEWNENSPCPSSSSSPWRIYNIGRGKPEGLMNLVEAIEAETGKKAEKILAPIPAGDVPQTWADTQNLETRFGYTPKVDIRTGIGHFVRWYRKMYGEK
ncbi:MAG: NAD-dependent epimerase [Spirochaetales bacterium]|nr:NAD-dependent epimerase [Spirochaetales bacterium]